MEECGQSSRPDGLVVWFSLWVREAPVRPVPSLPSQHTNNRFSWMFISFLNNDDQNHLNVLLVFSIDILLMLWQHRYVAETPIVVVEFSSIEWIVPWALINVGWLVFYAVGDPWACISCHGTEHVDSLCAFDWWRLKPARWICEHYGFCRAFAHRHCRSLYPHGECSVLDVVLPIASGVNLEGRNDRRYQGEGSRVYTWLFAT